MRHKLKTSNNPTIPALMGCFLLFAISGCDTEVTLQDLKDHLDSVKQEQDKQASILVGAATEQSKQVPVDVTITKNPFANTLGETAKSLGNRTNTPLTYYELDNIKLVGMVNEGGRQWGYVEVPGGSVYKIEEGTPIGINHGTVTEISPGVVEVKERMFNKAGDFLQRTVYLGSASRQRP